VRYQFVDCRFDLFDPAHGRALYLESHIAGASFLDLDEDLSDMSMAPAAGRHPLPSAEAFARSAGRAGIGAGVGVIAYDEAMSGGAARLWWLLRHFGHDDVEILEGGLSAWNGPVRSGREEIEPQTFVPHLREGDTVDADGLMARLGDPGLVVVDARAPARFRGDPADDPISALDPVAGHIPGAVNVPHADGDELPERVLEAAELVVYCGSGVTACVDLYRLAVASREDAKLYPGSWSEWCRRGLPAETGAGAE
jgi:thiosulfate/3-mercaptopyruvate sulfurtransferase